MVAELVVLPYKQSPAPLSSRQQAVERSATHVLQLTFNHFISIQPSRLIHGPKAQPSLPPYSKLITRQFLSGGLTLLNLTNR
jgi:hypothetical protein